MHDRMQCPACGGRKRSITDVACEKCGKTLPVDLKIALIKARSELITGKPGSARKLHAVVSDCLRALGVDPAQHLKPDVSTLEAKFEQAGAP